MREISVLESWLSEVAKSKMTERNYRARIHKFEETVGVTIEEIAKEWSELDYNGEKLFRKKWDMKIKMFRAYLKSSGIAQGTLEAYMIPIASFFSWLDTRVKVANERQKVTYHNRDITREEIEAIITHVPHVRDKAFYCIQAQSGLRPHSLKLLQYRDIKEDWEKGVVPVRIIIPESKNKGEYKAFYTFMALDSIQLLRQYWDLRFGKGVNPNDNDLLFSMSDRENIPINTASTATIFSNVARKLGIAKGEKGKPKDVRQFNLRKWFRMKSSESPEVDSEYSHFWMGHKLNRQDEHYFSSNIDLHREKYTKAMPYLEVFKGKELTEVETLKTQLAEKEKQLGKVIALLHSKGIMSIDEAKTLGFSEILEHAKRTMAYAEIQDVERNIKISPIQILQVAKEESTELVTSNEDIKPKRLFEDKKLIE